MTSTGILNEYMIHSQLKSWYSGADDIIEQKLEGFMSDIIKKIEAVRIYENEIGRGFCCLWK
jgi:hypothetical protein